MKDMFFEHDYAGSKKSLKVVYIEYQDDNIFSVTASSENGIQYHFDFEEDCKEYKLFMFFHSGAGGSIEDIEAPYRGQIYWMHPTAKFKGETKAINAIRLDKPIEYNGNPNPFENGREVYRTDYCKFCDMMYDEDACPEHHVVNENGELEYFDGTSCEG